MYFVSETGSGRAEKWTSVSPCPGRAAEAADARSAGAGVGIRCTAARHAAVAPTKLAWSGARVTKQASL